MLERLKSNSVSAENAKLKEIITDLENIFKQLDQVREKYKNIVNTNTEATVDDSERVKNMLKKYSQFK